MGGSCGRGASRGRPPSRGARCRTPAIGRVFVPRKISGFPVSFPEPHHVGDVLLTRGIFGGENGKRNFALAARRADPGDHPAVAVLRPLRQPRSTQIRLRRIATGPDFFWKDRLNSSCPASFFAELPI